MRKGFTLIELLIVVAIVGILAAIAVPNFVNALVRAKIARVQGDLSSIATALAMYHADSNNYPLSVDVQTGAILPHTLRLKPLTTPTAYMAMLPPDIFRPEVPPSYLENYGWLRSGRYGVDFPGGLDINFFQHDSWILSSVGPAAGRPDVSDGYGQEDSYAPSNGLHSLGAIIRSGG
ncbi:hypothetical protein COU01_00845 [Candidatus Falkowbacteria bacterium CG10_big_fil_rev_8_21_14_0_10_44_15]|uniref:Type II secretion system protein GspG C-terminal domain-containing protein n=1 Tax=Candidatus Falkowbacteria bacterium CG10_big_fil_rev_8_21_14_0_10_44_15 TaxID=1974569 RepID=A0A2H0V0J1_9BACT|nr:MAG: hypothetical protein COU01_00845 [Candidatus Falkowbacteria bacterium CG10_big_fil_rev_8_21_14_0_10_44_15]